MITITQTIFEISNIKGSTTYSISCCFCEGSSSSSNSTTITTTTTPLISSSSRSSSSSAVVAVAVMIDSTLLNLFIYSFIYLLKADTFCINTLAFIIFYFPLKSFIRICFLCLYAIKPRRYQCIGMIWAPECFLLKMLKFNPVESSIQGGWVLNLDYRWSLNRTVTSKLTKIGKLLYGF